MVGQACASDTVAYAQLLGGTAAIREAGTSTCCQRSQTSRCDAPSVHHCPAIRPASCVPIFLLEMYTFRVVSHTVAIFPGCRFYACMAATAQPVRLPPGVALPSCSEMSMRLRILLSCCIHDTYRRIYSPSPKHWRSLDSANMRLQKSGKKSK